MSVNPHSSSTEPFPVASDPARLFIIGGMLLIIAGMIFGDIYAIFILHPNAANIGNEMGAAVNAAMARDADSVFSHFGAVGGLLENAGTKKDAHVHIIHMGFIALLLAFMQPWVSLSDRHKLLLARTFMWASVLLPVCIFLIHYVGLVYSPLQSIGWASIGADLAGLILALIVLAELVGLWRHMRGNGEHSIPVHRLDSGNARTLLGGGVLLVMAGYLWGAYYAGIHLDEHEVRELTILGDLIQQTSVQDSAGVGQSLMAYGGLQGERILAIASHAHVIEMGLLAIMMAIVQPFVFLGATWRRRLVWMLLGGGMVLPIAIYSELWFGLLAGGVADFAGLMVILAVSGMLIGVLRHTGKIDAAEES